MVQVNRLAFGERVGKKVNELLYCMVVIPKCLKGKEGRMSAQFLRPVLRARRPEAGY